jgi:probable non-F420 flavinoid oxidoreductase
VTLIGYHASHEQFGPADLLGYVQLAEAAGFAAAKSSDHWQPWTDRQGEAGFAWSWLGAALQATRLPFGSITAPGYRYHPAIIAQAAATLGLMFEDRFWLALGSGEAINEAMTGLPWPEKARRNAVLLECFEVIKALFAGETVTHRGSVTVVEARLYSRPARPVPLYAAALSAATARFAGGWAEGLLTTGGHHPDAVRRVIDAFREGGGEGKPVVLQCALSWAGSEAEAVRQAIGQWGHCIIGGDVVADLRRPADFDEVTRRADEADLRRVLPIAASLAFHEDWIGRLLELGVAELHLHQVGRNQQAFIETFGGLARRLSDQAPREPAATV